MPKFLNYLRQGFQMLGFAKPDTTPVRECVKNIANTYNPKPELPWEPIPERISGQSLEALVGKQFLQTIIAQVNSQGFHVESVAVFRYANLNPSESIVAIEHWAKNNGLKVSMNHEHGICFFEKCN